MLYKLNNFVLLNNISIPEVERVRLFNYSNMKFKQYLPKFNSNDSASIINFLVNALYILAS